MVHGHAPCVDRYVAADFSPAIPEGATQGTRQSKQTCTRVNRSLVIRPPMGRKSARQDP
jgi:hypothetical protein